MVRKRRSTSVIGSSKSSVDVLLAEKVDHLGDQGDIVRVKPGYARNFLLPYGLATVATEHNERMVVQHQKRLAELEKDRLKSLKALAEKLSKHSVTMEANANEDGHLYGSIVAVDISKSLKEGGFDVDAEGVRLEGPLKELGMYTVKLQLHEKVKTEVKVWVVPAAEKK
ncbi:50S ribosomal protein L9 [Gimesia aquarii]|uniref:Large ribosomal subunit protein bL9 n=1 Tax=Gimesia aquarii TaxID=2527964 RepID=A0A517W0Z5_9PLAN|nr:50S ribosomal protein L9 [Gimesia aquarii]QDT98925.1 50S ribosomal protein L9 [Gimesia aquarii]